MFHIMNASEIDESTTYGRLKMPEENPRLSRRKLSGRLGVSPGKVNFCRLRALVDKGSLKINNFRNSSNKPAYAYLLTPSSVEKR